MRSRRSNASDAGLVVVAILAMALSRDARAQPPPTDDVHRAQVLFDEGVAALQRSEWAAACAAFTESHALDPAGGTALDLGFCHEKQGHLASALAAYRDAAKRATADGRSDREKLAAEKIAELESRTSRVRVRVAAAVLDIDGLEVVLDGAPLYRSAFGEALPADPGSRTVTARAPGRRATVRQFDVPAERAVVEITIDALEDEAPPTPTTDVRPVPRPAPEAPRDDTGRGRRTVAMALGGGGLAFVAAGVVTGVLAAGRHADSDRLCPSGACTPEGVAAEEDANRLAWASNGTFLAGAILVGVGAYLWLTAPRAQAKPPASVTSASPVAAPGGILVRF